MLILAIDTTGATLSAALLEDLTVRAELSINTGENHSLHLLPSIRHLYDRAGVALETTDLFVCTLGPGSFTGVRIGVATIKGFAMATGKPAAGFSSLEALAANLAPFSGSICPLLDAQRGQIYAAAYELDECFIPQLKREARLTDIPSFISRYTDKDQAIFLGSGALKYADLIKDALPGAMIAPARFSQVKASVVGCLGLGKFQQRQVLDAVTFTPLYLRLAEAERKLDMAADGVIRRRN
jgi:tRNA threonylcarbamoyladenosine biosynthesis protein TsaB